MSAARILVVDDEEGNRRLLREILEPQGYEVREAADGDEALAAMAESAPDLVLLDLMMPRRDGYSVCREIKSDPRTRLVPVIILTTLDQMQDKLKAIELGADDFLNKPSPLTPEEFTLMKTHPSVGANLCKSMRTMERVLPLIRHHHEKLDGSGYPDGLAGKEIPLLVRIITAADVYDALATARPYRKALPHDTCMKILREEVSKGWWDRDIVDLLERTRTAATPHGGA